MKRKSGNILQFYLVLASILGVITAGDLYHRALSSGSAFLWFILGFTVVFILGCAGLIVILNQNSSMLEDGLYDLLSGPRLWWLMALFSVLVVECIQDILFLHADLKPVLYGRYEVLLLENISLIFSVLAFSVLSLIYLIGLRVFQENSSISLPGIKWNFLIPFFLILSFWVWNLISGFGFKNHAGASGFFQPVGAPLVGLQIVVVMFVWILLSRVWRWLADRYTGGSSWAATRWLIPVVIWACAFVLWMDIPLQPNYFVDAPRPPNYEMYPLSDSITYETEAHRVINGEGFSEMPYHPFYNLFLGGLHTMAGDQYTDIIWLEVAVLSLIPVLLFGIFRRAGLQNAGMLISALFILRERNNLLLMDSVSGSNVKFLMTEPLALLVSLSFVYFCLVWLDGSRDGIRAALLAGGAAGLASLIRVELLVLIPVFLAAGIAIRTQGLFWLRGIVPFLVGAGLIIFPWVLRNYQHTGVPFIDKYDETRERYRYLVNFFDGSTTPEYRAEGRQSGDEGRTDEINPSTTDRSDIFSKHKFANHLTNNLSQLFLFLPSNHQPILTMGSFVELPHAAGKAGFSEKGIFSDVYVTRYVKSLPYHWFNWDGGLVSRSIFPVLLSTVLLSLGLERLWDKKRSLLVLLLLFMGIYIAGYSAYGSSGARYIQVVDWISLSFYGLGLSTILGNFHLLPSGGESGLDLSGKTAGIPDYRNIKRAAAVLLLVGIGAALPLSESFIPARFTERKLEQVIQGLDVNQTGVDRLRQLREGNLPPAYRTAYGKAIYPRYFPAGERMEDDRFGEIPDFRVSRIEFILVGTQNTWVTIPLAEPVSLPHGSEVVVVGTYQPGRAVQGDPIFGPHLEAEVLLLSGEERIIEASSGNHGQD